MKKLCLILAAGLAVAPAAAQENWVERPDWSAFFAAQDVGGTIVVVDERSQEYWVHDAARAGTRFTPASTFKIPHALFALEAGVVDDEFQIFAWDGTTRSIAAWNRDQDLRSSMRHSVVWLYQLFAREIGLAREREYLERIAFLRQLYRNQLPFAVAHQRLVKDVMIVEAGRDWILRAKTGWAARRDPHVGWWVGWVERPEGAVFFALNIDMPNQGDDAPKREAIARAVLQSLRALP